MVVIILVGRLALGIAYSVVVPAYEGFDEHHHYEYVRYIATKRHLLRPGEYDSEVLWEKFQAPLYYVLAGPFMSWIDVSDNYEPVSNRYFPSETSGPYYHLPAKWEAFPYRGTVLALHVIRLVSVIYGYTWCALHLSSCAGNLPEAQRAGHRRDAGACSLAAVALPRQHGHQRCAGGHHGVHRDFSAGQGGYGP